MVLCACTSGGDDVANLIGQPADGTQKSHYVL